MDTVSISGHLKMDIVELEKIQKTATQMLTMEVPTCRGSGEKSVPAWFSSWLDSFSSEMVLPNLGTFLSQPIILLHAQGSPQVS